MPVLPVTCPTARTRPTTCRPKCNRPAANAFPDVRPGTHPPSTHRTGPDARPDAFAHPARRPRRGLQVAALRGSHRGPGARTLDRRSEEHTSELQSLRRISHAVFCLKKKNRIVLTIQWYPYLAIKVRRAI